MKKHIWNHKHPDPLKYPTWFKLATRCGLWIDRKFVWSVDRYWIKPNCSNCKRVKNEL